MYQCARDGDISRQILPEIRLRAARSKKDLGRRRLSNANLQSARCTTRARAVSIVKVFPSVIDREKENPGDS